jgi:hypothetical protein
VIGELPYAATGEGRILLALRAGPIEAESLAERAGDFQARKALPGAIKDGLVKKTRLEWTYVFSLTAKGMAKCPTRRSLVGWVPDECKQVASTSELAERV